MYNFRFDLCVKIGANLATCKSPHAMVGGGGRFHCRHRDGEEYQPHVIGHVHVPFFIRPKLRRMVLQQLAYAPSGFLPRFVGASEFGCLRQHDVAFRAYLKMKQQTLYSVFASRACALSSWSRFAALTARRS